MIQLSKRNYICIITGLQQYYCYPEKHECTQTRLLPENTYNDTTLFNLIAAGDELAFKHLFVTYSKLLHPFIIRIVQSVQESEEIIQQVFLKCWLKRDQLSEVAYPKAYIFRMAANECYAYLRREAVNRKRITGGDPGDIAEESRTGIYELEDMVKKACEKLPPRQREIYVLSRHQHLKIEEIAEKLDISPLTVKNSLVKSLKFIRDFVGAELYMLLVIACMV